MAVKTRRTRLLGLLLALAAAPTSAQELEEPRTELSAVRDSLSEFRLRPRPPGPRLRSPDPPETPFDRVVRLYFETEAYAGGDRAALLAAAAALSGKSSQEIKRIYELGSPGIGSNEAAILTAAAAVSGRHIGELRGLHRHQAPRQDEPGAVLTAAAAFSGRSMPELLAAYDAFKGWSEEPSVMAGAAALSRKPIKELLDLNTRAFQWRIPAASTSLGSAVSGKPLGELRASCSQAPAGTDFETRGVLACAAALSGTPMEKLLEWHASAPSPRAGRAVLAGAASLSMGDARSRQAFLLCAYPAVFDEPGDDSQVSLFRPPGSVYDVRPNPYPKF